MKKTNIPPKRFAISGVAKGYKQPSNWRSLKTKILSFVCDIFSARCEPVQKETKNNGEIHK